MSSTNIQVGDVIGWFKSGLSLTFKNPGAFIVMGLVFGVISIVLAFIPVLGAIAMLVLAPVFYGGFIHAAREEDQGRKAEIGHLFVGFQQPGKIGPMMMLCLPSVAAGILAAILGFVLIGGSIAAMAMGGNGGGMGIMGLVLFALIAFALGLGAAAMTYFAVPRVMLDGIEPIAAMKESLGVVLANIASILVGFIVIGLLFMIVGIIPLLGALAIFLIGMPASLCAMYFGYRQAFGGGSAAQVEAPTPPAPPPVVQ